MTRTRRRTYPSRLAYAAALSSLAIAALSAVPAAAEIGRASWRERV